LGTSATKQEETTDTASEDPKDDPTTSKTTKNKKRAGKKNDLDISEQEPKAKKIRVKPEKAQEVREKLLEEMIKNYTFGMKEVPMDMLAAAVGYKNPRSDAITAAMKLLMSDGVAEKTKNICKLTDKSVKQYVPEEAPAASPEEAMEQFRKQLEMKLAGFNATVQEAAQAVWDLLKDGKKHTMEEVVGVTSYNMERSTGFAEVMKAMKQLGFTEKANKKLWFTDKVFIFPEILFLLD